MEKQNFNSITNLSIQEMEHKLRQFQADFESGINSGITFADLEKNLEELLSNTRKIYLDALSDYLSLTDETAIIKQKKENTGKEG